MITVKPSKEIVAGKEFTNACEHCNSRENVYEITIDAITSRIIKIHLCKECLEELKKAIDEKDKPDTNSWLFWFEEGMKLRKKYEKVDRKRVAKEIRNIESWMRKTDNVIMLYVNCETKLPDTYSEEFFEKNTRSEDLLDAFFQGFES